MRITSTAFSNNEQIPTRYTCDGEEIHPPLTISEPPKDAKSFALIMDDLDAKHEEWNWLHWTMWNIPPHTAIMEGTVPPGVTQGKTSDDTYHYVGPCPPRGTHRYRFRIFALDKELDVDPDSNAEDLEEEMDGHVLDEAELIGLYARDGEAIWHKHSASETGQPPEESRRTPPIEPGYTEEE